MVRGIPDKRSAIMKAAVRLFASGHFHTSTIPEIAALAGVGEGTIYHYFPNKRELAENIFQESNLALAREVREAYPTKPSPKERVNVAISVLLRKAEREPDLMAFLFLARHEYMDPVTLAKASELTRLVAKIVDEGLAAGQLKPLPPRIMVGLVLGVVREGIRQRQGGQFRRSLVSLGADLGRCAWDSIAKS